MSIKCRLRGDSHGTDGQKAADMLATYEQRIATLEAENAALRAEKEALEKPKPAAWSVLDKRTKKHWYTNESKSIAAWNAQHHSHREPDGSPSMLVVPLYTHPVPARTLTDDVIYMIAKKCALTLDRRTVEVDFARAIEAWLKGGE